MSDETIAQPMRDAALDARDEFDRLHSELKYANRNINSLRVMLVDLSNELQQARERCRRAAEDLIEEIGASGPENVEDTAGRAAAIIRQLREHVAADRERTDAQGAPAEDGCPNCGHAWHAEKDGHCAYCDCKALERKAPELLTAETWCPLCFGQGVVNTVAPYQPPVCCPTCDGTGKAPSEEAKP